MVETAGVIKESHVDVERLIVRRLGMVGMVRKMGICTEVLIIVQLVAEVKKIH